MLGPYSAAVGPVARKADGHGGIAANGVCQMSMILSDYFPSGLALQVPRETHAADGAKKGNWRNVERNSVGAMIFERNRRKEPDGQRDHRQSGKDGSSEPKCVLALVAAFAFPPRHCKDKGEQRRERGSPESHKARAYTVSSVIAPEFVDCEGLLCRQGPLAITFRLGNLDVPVQRKDNNAEDPNKKRQNVETPLPFFLVGGTGHEGGECDRRGALP